jgi:hypothetical protein
MKTEKLTDAHTPGPWHVLGPWPSVHVGPMVDPGCGFPDPEPPMYEPVCCLYESEDYKTEPPAEVKANAKLIAASPEMLAAIEGAMKIADLWSPNTKIRLTLEAAGHLFPDEEARALIAMRRNFERIIEKARNNQKDS